MTNFTDKDFFLKAFWGKIHEYFVMKLAYFRVVAFFLHELQNNLDFWGVFYVTFASFLINS